MSDSRRRFLKAGVMAALFAALPLKNVFGQSWKERDGNPGETPVTQSDPLANYSKASFTSYLNSIFQLQTSIGVVVVTLTRIDDMPAPKGGECFTMIFRGGHRALPQETYMITHPSLGNFFLFLVPAGTDQNGAQGYSATINRLSPADFANMSAPTRVAHSSGTSSTTSTTSTTATPTVTPTVIPAIITSPTVVPTTTTPTLKRGRRRRKPTRKNDDDPKHLISSVGAHSDSLSVITNNHSA